MKYILIILFLIGFQIGKCNTYYFSTTDGDDTRTSVQAQNSATPWKTISKLNSFFSSLAAGDNVLFKRGDTFSGGIVCNKSGTAGNLITIGAYGSGAKPIITGFTTTGAFTSAGGGLYTVGVGALASVNVVLLDDVFQPMGKDPKGPAGYYTISSTSGTSPVIINSSGIGSVPSMVGGEICWRARHWAFWRGTITAQSSTSVTSTPFAATSGGPTETPIVNYGFFFQNAPATCTTLGEWAYNKGTNILTMYFGGGGPGSHVVKVASTDVLVELNGFDFIKLNFLDLRGGNSYIVRGVNSTDITIDSCNVFGAGVYAIFGNGTAPNWTITNNGISYANSNGVFAVTNTGWTITGNTIDQIGNVAGMGGTGEGQYFATRDIGNNGVISNNVVTNSGYIGINFKGTNVTVKKNFVNGFCNVKDDGSGIYFGGFNFSGSKVDSNIVINGIGRTEGTPDAGDPRAHGIYADDGTSNVEIYGNSCALNSQNGIYCHNGHDLNIHDNTMWDNALAGMRYYNDGNTIGNITYKHNISFAKSNSELVYTSGGGTDNPKDSFWCSGCLDSNYYNRPISETNHFQTAVPSGTYSLSSWKTFVSPLDSHSLGSPKTVSSTDSLRFDYNNTSSPLTINLGAKWEDVTGTVYNGSITIQPFQSSVLIFVGNLTNQKGFFFFKH